ncbi:Protein kinase-like domain [Pseudocohnilembus persalinus]|uniref:Cyclin-dependent kinase 2 homolog n=1 Tax=Pseudocohnilembus persalinus TaxID=266149 RepID=A0A0V0QCR7_PSEPJ|nr:Protein kinase-like domain [Pseudocohnilembus persalinus]|eukprot:KRX00029.1 Protein kinase-like domain [Pseudocohnilembus persalinus]
MQKQENIDQLDEESSNSLFDAGENENNYKKSKILDTDSQDEEEQKNDDKNENDQDKKIQNLSKNTLSKQESKELAKKHAHEITEDEKKSLLRKRKICGFVQGCDSIENYEKLNKIHEGVYGVVYRAKDKLLNQICAIKKVKIDREKEKEGFPITSIREFNILLSLKHENIVGVKRIVVGPDLDKIFMIMEYCEHELKDLIDGMKFQFSEAEIKCLMQQFLKAMKYLHQKNIFHRDLKTSNILYTNKGVLKVCDFGLGRKFLGDKKAYTAVVVTLWYRAPELLLGNEKYNLSIDMWSVGCIFAELILRTPIFKGQGEMDQLQKIFEVVGTPSELSWKGWTQLKHARAVLKFPKYENKLKEVIGNSISEEGIDLLKQLLALDPARRITAAKALEHPWFKKMPLPQQTDLMPTFPDSNDIARDQRKKVKK